MAIAMECDDRARQLAVALAMGKRLARSRERLGLSQPQVAERLSTTTNTVWRYEHGVNAPSLLTLHRLAALYGVSVASLVDPDNAREVAA